MTGDLAVGFCVTVGGWGGGNGPLVRRAVDMLYGVRFG